MLIRPQVYNCNCGEETAGDNAKVQKEGGVFNPIVRERPLREASCAPTTVSNPEAPKFMALTPTLQPSKRISTPRYNIVRDQFVQIDKLAN